MGQGRKNKRRLIAKVVPLGTLLTGIERIDGQEEYDVFWEKFREWVGKTHLKAESMNIGCVTGNTVVTLKLDGQYKVEVSKTLHDLSIMTMDEFSSMMNAEVQKAVRKEYINTFKL